MPMKPGMKMMMMKRVTQDESRNHSEYGGSPERRMIGYDRDYGSENRRMNYGMDEPESRRRRDSRGRFMEGDGWEGNRGYPRSEYDEHRYGIDRPDYYAHLAKDFLKDKDAKPHKLRRYMEHIAK